MKSVLTLGAALFFLLIAASNPASAQVNGIGQKPYLGWSTFSEQTINGNFLTQTNIQAQSDALKASGLQDHGFQYINIDSGWQGSFDSNGRPIPNPSTFPDITALISHIHANGQKAGIYWIPGIEQPAVDGNYPILGTSYHTQDITPMPLQKGNTFAGSLPNPYHDKIDFTRPGAQEYINSVVALFASWGVDYIKLDAVAPGSDVYDLSIDNRPDVQAWSQAIVASGRPMWFTISWDLDLDYLSTWEQFANARRIDQDVECEGDCATLTNWPRIVQREYDDVNWENASGVTKGWNDMDTLDVGDGATDGLTYAEKQSAITIWSMGNSPLTLGGDLTQLDSFAKSAFTNDELIAVDQSGHPAVQMTGGYHPVWLADTGDGNAYVALYNLNAFTDRVDVRWSDLGFSNATAVRDIWNKSDLGAFAGGFSTMVLGHGTRLLKVTPDGAITPITGGQIYEAEAATLTGSASVASCMACSGGQKAGNIGQSSTVVFSKVNVKTAGVYRLEIDALTLGPRSLTYSVNGAPADTLNLSGGSFELPQSSTVPVTLSAGDNTITFGNPAGYGADLDRIVLSGDGSESAPTFNTYEAEGAQLAGTASIGYSTLASGGSYVGNYGAGAANTITFPNVAVPSTGTYQLEIDYTTSGTRTFFVSVNGSDPKELDVNGSTFDAPVPYILPVQLDGGSPNTIVFSNPNASGYAPGLDNITVSLGANTSPSISPAGGAFTSVQTVSIADTTPGASIFYTIDGTAPTSASNAYSGPFAVSASETVNAIAIAAGYPDSAVASSAYIIALPVVATPIFTPVAGAYTSVQAVSISDSTEGAAIYYTTDGTVPTMNSTLYASAISVTNTEIIQAISVAAGYTNSAVASAAYTINLPPPTISLALGSAALSIPRGQAGSVSITVTPQNGFSSAVNFSCSGLPAGATCSFSPATVRPTGASAATSTLTISTTSQSAALHGMFTTAFPGSALAFAVCLFGWRKRRGVQALLSFAVLALGLAMLSGCGDSSQKPTTTTVTVVASSGSTQQSATLSLTIQ
jgi:alpha-galactosidase